MNMTRIAVLAALSAIVVVVFSIIGAFANATWSGLGIGLVVAGGIVWFIGRRPVDQLIADPRTTLVARRVAIVILVIAVPALVVGMWSPEIKASFDRWSGNQKQTLANAIDKDSLQSEPEVGVIATLAEKTALYNKQGEPVWAMPAGVRVKLADLEGVPSQERLEGMTKVVIENKFGDFVGGNVVYVPSRKLKFG